jgi:sigma-B regulation protein RsbU (phosphoserine phosphatase)
MLEYFLFGLWLFTTIVFVVVYWNQRQQIAGLGKARATIELEEARIFEFIHGLSDAFTEEIRAADLHRLIVEGAVRLLGAQGGCLYLFDRTSNTLRPVYISDQCPPLVEIPPHVRQQAETTPEATGNYIRLHAVASGEGLVGSVWQDQQPISVGRRGSRLGSWRESTATTEAALLSPLNYANQKIGVLAIANGSGGAAFTQSAFTIFKAIAEQSAFALYSVIIFSEASEKRRLDRDLQLAQQIQRVLLPSVPPESRAFEIRGLNIPAHHVSGDYFDFIKVDEKRLGVAIADVSGKGVPASLIMAMCRSVLRSQARGNSSAAAVLDAVNRQLFPDVQPDMFISMAYVILNDETGEATLCRAGHDAPLHYAARERTVRRINPPGMAVGIDSGEVFRSITSDFPIALEQDDCLILYTDGVTEALDASGTEFGLTRAIRSIESGAAKGVDGIMAALTGDVKNFIGSSPQNDDITLIVIRKKCP